jgi:hypothetical protein
MKRSLSILAVLAFSALPAHAEVIASSPNEAGGQILLTNAKGSCTSGLLLMSTTRTGEYLHGCWAPYDNQVFVVYSDGTIRLYSMDGFVLRNRESRPAKSRGQSL